MQHPSRGGRETSNDSHRLRSGLPSGNDYGTGSHQHFGDSLGKRETQPLLQLLRFGIACLLRQYGLLVSAFGLAGGAAIYFLLPFEPDLFGVLIGLTGLVMARLAFLLIHANACISRACLAVLTALAIGILSGKLATLRAASPALPELKEPVLLEGWVEAIDTGAKGPRLRLLVHAVSGYDRAIFPDHVRVTHRLSRHVDVGRFVRCWVVLRPPPVPPFAQVLPCPACCDSHEGASQSLQVPRAEVATAP